MCFECYRETVERIGGIMPRPKTQAEYIRNLKRIYDSFEVKDLTWDEFRNQMLDLQDPKKMMDDLGDIELRKARERLNRMRVKKAMEIN